MIFRMSKASDILNIKKIQIDTLEELLAFTKKTRKESIVLYYDEKERPTIIDYDSYIE